MCLGASCKCSPLFYKDITGGCLSFTEQLKITVKSKDTKGICNETTLTTSSMSCMVPNKAVTHKTNLRSDTTEQCKEKNELNCVPDQSRCHKMSDVCIYRLDVYNHLTPCRQGSHLQECQKFQLLQMSRILLHPMGLHV